MQAPGNGVTNLADHRRAKARQRALARPPRRRTSHINIQVGGDGKLTFSNSNLTRRNAFKLLLGLYIVAGEVFRAISIHQND
jgi:hypothetical protein